MSSFTRRAILDAFLRILSKKPFRKITVRDIVEECEVNRTTFYYYFQDVYAIVEELFSSMMAPCAAVLLGRSAEEELRDVGDFARMHRRALKNLWQGLSEEELHRYFGRELDGAIAACVDRFAEGLSVGEKEKRAVALFQRESLLGFFRLFILGELPEENIPIGHGLYAATKTMLLAMSDKREEEL